MPSVKAVGPDQITMEVQKSLGEEGLKWLTELFNIIFMHAKMPREWRRTDVALLSLSTRTKTIFKIETTIQVLSCLATR